jgi:hypothetical protein
MCVCVCVCVRAPPRARVCAHEYDWNLNMSVCMHVQYIVTDLLNALLGNGSVTTFQHATMGGVFSVGKCYSSLLGSTTILATEGVFYVVRATQQ